MNDDAELVRMPDLTKILPLHEIHDAWRVAQRGIPPEWFMYEVGNFQTALPEHGIGNPVHLPCCRPGVPDGNGFGWGACDFLLVLPAVDEIDNDLRTCMVGRSGRFVRDELKRLGIDEDRCRVTHALRFQLPKGMTSYKQQHKQAGMAYVQADAYACNPKVIITFGSDSLKALFGKNAKLDSYRGAVHEWNGIKVVPTVSPSVFAKSLGGVDVFRSELYRAVQVTMGTYQVNSGWKPGYTWCTTIDQMAAVAKEIIEGGFKELAIDTEFGNDTTRDEDSYLLSFQVCWAPGKAAYFQLRADKGGLMWMKEERAVIDDIIRAIVLRPGVQLLGQHLRTDVEMPKREGLDWEYLLETGWDTMLANHLLRGGSGDESQGLDHLTRRYCPEFGAYWKSVEDWLDAHGRGEMLRYGYKLVPVDILALYGCQDVDVTFISAVETKKELKAEPRLEALFNHLVMPCSAAIMDIQSHGILLDTNRIKVLHDIYEPEYAQILQELRDLINWQDFNPNSNSQKASLLFSTQVYRDKKPAAPGALVCDLEPLFNTDKFPVEWSVIRENKDEKYHSPSCKAATIDLLYQKHKNDNFSYAPVDAALVLKKLKQLSVLGKFLTTYLTEAELNEHGVREGGKNIGNNIWKDGRVRGKLHQTSETGRWRMTACNLQTSPKKQEEAALEVFIDRWHGLTVEQYRKLCSDECKEKTPELYIEIENRVEYLVPSFKSCYISPKGSSIIEVDFKTAELAVLAFASGDELLTKIIEQGRDLHAENAAKAFKLALLAELKEVLEKLQAGDKEPYAKWVKQIKKLHNGLRTAAKTVVFGLMYGRSAGALAREIRKTGVDVSVADCQQLIDAFASAYPKAWNWIKANKESALINEYVEAPSGRRRYFPGISDMGKSEQAAAQREASNSPIQGCVADLLAQAAVNLNRFLKNTEEGRRIGYKVLLPIHDAFWIEVKNEHVERMKEIVEFCMVTMNQIPGSPKSIGIDLEVFPFRVGEKDAEEEDDDRPEFVPGAGMQASQKAIDKAAAVAKARQARERAAEKVDREDKPDFADPEWDLEYKLTLDKLEVAK